MNYFLADCPTGLTLYVLQFFKKITHSKKKKKKKLSVDVLQVKNYIEATC